MLLTPQDHPFNWKQPPRLVLGLGLVLALIFLFWHRADVTRQADLNQRYEHELLAVEWPLYETHLLRAGQRHTLEQLKQARADGHVEPLARYLGTDARFVESVALHGSDYLSEDELARWKSARHPFDKEQRKLGAEALGVDPQQFRPITFLTHTLVNESALQFLGALLLLLTAGMALELALGSGAVLTAFLGGGVVGALVYLLANGGGVLPLAGSGAAIASVVGMFAAHFRLQGVTWFGRLTLTALLIPALWLFFMVIQFWGDGIRLPVLLAQLAGLLSGPLWYVIHQRWFAHDGDAQETIAAADDSDADREYREQLQQALDAVARMEFPDAQKRLRELVKRYPHDLRVITQLYHLEKMAPDSTTFDAVARRLFQLSTHREDGAHAVLPLYRDYDKVSLEKRALDTETSLKLVMRFARIGEVKEAEKLMKGLLARKVSHALLPKAALALAQAFEQLHDPARAAQYRDMAAQGAASPS